MMIGEAGRDMDREPGRLRDVMGRRMAERVLGLVGPAQIVEQDPAVDVGLDVTRVELERPPELLQRPLRLPQHGIAETEEVVAIGEAATRLHDLQEQVDRAVVILQREALAGPIDQRFITDAHGSPGTSRQTGEFPQGKERWDDIPGPGPISTDRPTSGARPRAVVAPG